LLTTKEVAGRFRVAEATIRDWINRGEVPAIRYGKSYYVSEGMLKASRAAKERQAQRALEERRANAERQEELDLRRKREPDLLWDLSYCLGCGREPVLTTKNMRLDGEISCDACSSPEQGKTKDWWERFARVRVEEFGRAGHEGAPTPSEMDKADIYRCAICGMPRAIRRSFLADNSFFPDCDHGLPYRSWYSQLDDDPGAYDRIMVESFAGFAAEKLAGLQADLGWSVCRCARCGFHRAVATREQHLIGDTACRLCVRDKVPVNPSYRGDTVEEADFVHSDTFGGSIQQQQCGCGGWELISNDNNQPVLSWCSKRPLQERQDLAQAYTKRLSLSSDVRWRLLQDVQANVEADTIDMDNTPF
jgi:excisionase family DNA binding protein